MPETIVCEVTVTLGSGPRWSSTRIIEVEATDVIRFTIGAGDKDKKVEVQPGNSVRFLLIKPDSPSVDLSYKTGAGGGSHALEEPHLLPGKGAVGLLGGATSPTSLLFSNGGADEAGITIVVGRDAKLP